MANGMSILDMFNSVAAGFNAASKALELQELQTATEKKTEGADSPRSAPKTPKSPGQAFGPGKSCLFACDWVMFI